jgi:PleD family two-component response regulator
VDNPSILQKRGEEFLVVMWHTSAAEGIKLKEDAQITINDGYYGSF